MIKDIFLCFVPLFVAVDAIGVLPIFVSLTEGLTKAEKKNIIIKSVYTALCLAGGFILLGKATFKFLGITIGDFMIAGGSILFCIAIMDILTQKKKIAVPPDELSVVPLGTTLIVGPAVLTTCLISIGEHGITATLIAVVMNVIIAGILFYLSGFFIKLIGESGSRALSKIMHLLLAAIAVMMVRKGIFQLILSNVVK